MKLIEEVIVDAPLPTFRMLPAEDLRDRGFTQSGVAKAPSISQSAVPKYTHGGVAMNERVAIDPCVVDLAPCVDDDLVIGGMAPVQVPVEAEVLIRRLEGGNLLSDLHEDKMPELASHGSFWNTHGPEGWLRTVGRVRSSTCCGLRMFVDASGFAGLTPNVGSNFVESFPGVSNVDGVAAIPGHIFDVKGQATVLDEPELGVGGHAAGALPSARAAGADANAVLNIVYDAGAIEDFEAVGYEHIEFDLDVPIDSVRELFTARDLLEMLVIYQSDGYGTEPITYTPGPDVSAVADVVRVLF